MCHYTIPLLGKSGTKQIYDFKFLEATFLSNRNGFVNFLLGNHLECTCPVKKEREKTRVIDALRFLEAGWVMSDSMLTAAITGIAAVLIHGVTVHSMLQLLQNRKNP